MAIQITNTLTGKKELLKPIRPGKIGMYACGPTVYGLTHVGNARPTIFFDVVRRFFEFSKFEVTFISNFTDVDDKIINRAREEKTTSQEIATRFTAEFVADRVRMGVRPPNHAPAVTQHIPDIIALVERLIANGMAYATPDGEVLYSVRKFAEYGKLSKKKLDDLRVGVRIDPNEKKQDPLDFSLWKPQKAADEPAWDSPWGKGRPGWHIECSAMAIRYLGEHFDIHGGGLDLIHPHHENEIAQSEGATRKPFANYWLHNNLVNLESEKMSKSVGNIFLNRDFMTRFSPEVLRFLLLSSHYRSPIDFSEKHISECQAALHRFYTCLARTQELGRLGEQTAHTPTPTAETIALEKFSLTYESAWIAAMEDDFNTAKVVGLVFEYVRLANAVFDAKRFQLSPQTQSLAESFVRHFEALGAVINLFQESPRAFLMELRGKIAQERNIDPVDIDTALKLRAQARANKDYVTGDNIRKDLAAKGIEIRDTAGGSEWDFTLTAKPGPS